MGRKRTAATVTCHWCRQQSQRKHVTCWDCLSKFCSSCLKNRHGEDIDEELLVKWKCPKCRGGCGPGCSTSCCNCGPCQRSKGLTATGYVIRDAQAAGFTNAHDYLIFTKTRESARVMARRKDGCREKILPLR